jgi:putative acetyltransferase
MLAVRPERPEHYPAVRRVLQQAFGVDSSEADLVDALRASGTHVPELCLVAVDDERIVGHLCFSRARLESGDDVLALAPMAVVPERQREGIGCRLLEDGLRRATETAFPLIIVVGHATYYPRFGFVEADPYDLRTRWDLPAEAWMVLRLPAYRPTALTYPEAFTS